MGSIGPAESPKVEVATVDVLAAKALIQTGYVIYLDVRTVEEFQKGHVDAEKIINIPYMFNTPEGRVKNPEFLKEVSSACKKEDRLIVGCQSGVRSLFATADLQAQGYKDVSNMGGGYLDWVQKEFPVKTWLVKKEQGWTSHQDWGMNLEIRTHILVEDKPTL